MLILGGLLGATGECRPADRGHKNTDLDRWQETNPKHIRCLCGASTATDAKRKLPILTQAAVGILATNPQFAVYSFQLQNLRKGSLVD